MPSPTCKLSLVEKSDLLLVQLTRLTDHTGVKRVRDDEEPRPGFDPGTPAFLDFFTKAVLYQAELPRRRWTWHQ